MGYPKVIKGVVEKKVVIKEGIPGQTFDGGGYREIKWYLRGQDGKLYISFSTSSDFPYCPLWGCYEDCVNCFWWWERHLDCEICEKEDKDCKSCISQLDYCQAPELVLIETEEWIFRARPALEGE